MLSTEIAAYLDPLLDIANIADWPTAMNGLQLESHSPVRKIGAAVDGGEATLRLAAERGVDFLLVHHGMYWAGLRQIAGPFYRKLKVAFDANMAVYSAHLPLDLHPRFGNNHLLSQAIGLQNPEPFFWEHGRQIGFKAPLDVSLAGLCERVKAAIGGGPVRLIHGSIAGNLPTPESTAAELARTAGAGVVGVVTGGAGGGIARAQAEGVTTLLSGEASHDAFIAAEEHGMNLLLAGHYATETFGVKALAAHLAEKYSLPWEFLDHPSGL